MKLLFVTHLFYPAIGGVELHIKNVSEGLVKRGFRVKVLTTDAYSTEAFFLGDKRRIDKVQEIIDGVEVERLGFRTFGARFFSRLSAILWRFRYPFTNWIRFLSFGPRNRGFIRKITAYNPDVIYASPLPTMNVWYAYKAAVRLKKPLVIIPSFHIFDAFAFCNKIFFRMMRAADMVMALSPLEKDHLAKKGGVNPDRIIILPPFPLKEHQLGPVIKGIKEKYRIRERYNIKEKFVILHLGQHGLHKKVGVVVDAMRYVWQCMDVTDAALVIAGGKTGYTKVLKARATELEESRGGKVYFIDNFPSEEKDDIFRMADIFISLSEMESFGIVFVEAMNNGLPVVASRNGVARYIVEESRTGILVEPQTITEVAGAIIELLSDEEMRKRFSENARQKVMLNYHPQRILDKWEGVIADVVARRAH
jgi:glycosyltransferase involved in cell wall biosynthesis